MREEAGQAITGDDILDRDGMPEIVMPEHWAGEWVCERMIRAFETLRIVPQRIGPKEFGTIWAEYALDYKEVLIRPRAADGAVGMMEEALGWPGRYLAGETMAHRLARDAVGFWAYHSAMDHDIEPLIRERWLEAAARAEKIAADQNAMIAARRAAVVADGEAWFQARLTERSRNWAASEFEGKRQALDHQRWQRNERELSKLQYVKPRPADGANGVCITSRALRDYRRVGYDIIARGLRRDHVPVR